MRTTIGAGIRALEGHARLPLFDDPLAERLSRHGLTVLADVGAAEHQDRLLRPIGRTLRGHDDCSTYSSRDAGGDRHSQAYDSA